MAVGYPPTPIFPYGIDSDYTLFLVYNTAEAALAEDNDPWSEEIVITPRSNVQSEVWADNGFANINGELFYYDAVDKDVNGKVYKFKRCARNLGGVPTQFNSAGTMVRGFVVAEHHNQLVDGIILAEQFIGYNFTPDQSSLDWRIRNLQGIPIIFDDFGCPDVTFHFTVVSSDPSAGTVVDYNIDVVGSFNTFTLNFGDGSSTSSVQQGTHTYAPNANIDPVVTFTNQNCQIVQTPAERTSVEAPQAQVTPTAFSIPNPPTIVFPTINVQSPSIPEANITLPPFQFPCIDLSPLGINPVSLPSVILFEPSITLPSVIDFQPIQIPSIIDFGPLVLPSIIGIGISIPDIQVVVPDIPNISLIVPTISLPALSVSSFVFPNINVNVPTFPDISVNVPTFPNISVATPSFPNINVNVPVFPNINVNVPVFPNISVATPTFPNISVATPTFPSLTVNWGATPTVGVNWSPVPYISVSFGTAPNISMSWGTPPTVNFNWGTPPTVNVNWGTPPTVQVNVTVTCPSTPLALAAADPVGLTDDMLGIGKDLQVEYDVSGFPSEITIIPPDIPDVRIIHDLPSEITVKSPSFPNIKVDVPEFRDIRILPPETQLTIEAIGIPDVLKLEPTMPIPEKIELFVPVKIPEVIRLEHDIPDVIRVEGLPEVIRLEHNLPSIIKLEMPDKPEIELVYKGSPIPVQIELDVQKLIGDQDGSQCVRIVPCSK